MRTNVTIGSFVPGNETFTVWSFRSPERKCMGTKRPGTQYMHDIYRTATFVYT